VSGGSGPVATPVPRAEPRAAPEAHAEARARSVWIDGLHLAVLWGFAVLQPVLDVMSDSADFFVLRGVGGIDLVLVVIAVAVVPPGLMLALEALVGLAGRRARRTLHLIFVWGLAALLVVGVLNDLFPRGGWSLLVASAALGAFAAAAYARFAPVRSVVTVLGPAPVLFVLLFLLFSPAKRIAFPGDAAATAPGARSSTPLVMVVLDELPVSSLMDEHGRIDAGRYPNFGRLARQSTWFRNTTAAADETVSAVPAVLTGERPDRDKVPILADHPHNLFTLLGASHRVTAMEHQTLLCPKRLCPYEGSELRRMMSLASALSLVYAYVVTPGGLPVNLPPIGSAWEEAVRSANPKSEIDPDHAERAELTRHGGPQFEKFIDALEPLRSGRSKPPLYFFHASLPHVPWKYLPSGKVYAKFSQSVPGLRYEATSRWSDNRYLVEQGFQRHLLQVKFTDRLLGRLISRLRANHLWDEAAVVVASDHGASFRPGVQRRAVERPNAADVGMVPFFVKAPRQKRARIDDRHLQTIDIVPTVADVVGVRLPWRLDGRSAYRLGREGRGRLVISADAGGELGLGPSDLVRLRRRTLRHQITLFGTGAGEPALFRIGPARELVGRRVRDLTVERSAIRVELDDEGQLDSVDFDSPFVPALIRGRVDEPGDTLFRDVAIAVNGRVWATTQTFPSFDERYFFAMVPESALREGRNQVDVFSISRRAGGLVLEALRRDS